MAFGAREHHPDDVRLYGMQARAEPQPPPLVIESVGPYEVRVTTPEGERFMAGGAAGMYLGQLYEISWPEGGPFRLSLNVVQADEEWRGHGPWERLTYEADNAGALELVSRETLTRQEGERRG